MVLRRKKWWQRRSMNAALLRWLPHRSWRVHITSSHVVPGLLWLAWLFYLNYYIIQFSGTFSVFAHFRRRNLIWSGRLMRSRLADSASACVRFLSSERQIWKLIVRLTWYIDSERKLILNQNWSTPACGKGWTRELGYACQTTSSEGDETSLKHRRVMETGEIVWNFIRLVIMIQMKPNKFDQTAHV